MPRSGQKTSPTTRDRGYVRLTAGRIADCFGRLGGHSDDWGWLLVRSQHASEFDDVTRSSVVHRLERFQDIDTDPTGELILSAFVCAGAIDRQVVYVSTPITTGALSIEFASDASQHRSQAEVIRANIAGAKDVTARARSAFPNELTIEPTSLHDVVAYEQSDYHRLWCALIERYAKVVVFNDGWQYSTGCAAEFATAALSGVRILDHHLNDMPIRDAVRLLDEAVSRLEQSGRSVETHESVLSAVRAQTVSG